MSSWWREETKGTLKPWERLLRRGIEAVWPQTKQDAGIKSKASAGEGEIHRPQVPTDHSL